MLPSGEIDAQWALQPEAFTVDHQRFAAITRFAANVPDRRNMLKLAGAAAVASMAGILARADEAEAKKLTVRIRNEETDQSIFVDVKNKDKRRARAEARKICAVVERIDTELDSFNEIRLVCTIE